MHIRSFQYRQDRRKDLRWKLKTGSIWTSLRRLTVEYRWEGKRLWLSWDAQSTCVTVHLIFLVKGRREFISYRYTIWRSVTLYSSSPHPWRSFLGICFDWVHPSDEKREKQEREEERSYKHPTDHEVVSRIWYSGGRDRFIPLRLSIFLGPRDYRNSRWHRRNLTGENLKELSLYVSIRTIKHK